MAYGNWGAFVYKNGERQENREDNTPYKEDEMQAGYHQAFGGGDKGLGPHHASLGSGPFRLCGYKAYPRIYMNGEVVDYKPFLLNGAANWFDSDGIEGEIEGYKFTAEPMSDPESVSLKLIEPDGTVWTSRCGYCIGAGHED